MRISRRSRTRLALNMTICLLKCIDECQSILGGVLQIVIYGILNIPIRPLTANERLHLNVVRRFLMPERREVK